MTRKSDYQELEERIKKLEQTEFEFRQSQEALHHQMAFLELLMETIPLPVFYKNLDGCYTGCNRAFEEFIGSSREEIIGKSVYDMAPKHIADQYKQKDDELYRRPGRQRYEGHVNAKEGLRHVIFDKATIFGSRNIPEGIIGIITDITEIKQTEEALRQSEKKYRVLIEHTHDIIYSLDKDGVFTYVSPSWSVLLGHEVSEVEGKDFRAFVHPDDIPKCEQFLRRVIRSQQRLSGVEYRVLHAAGGYRWHTSNGTPHYDHQQNFICFIGVARDITERKRVEEKLRRSEERFRRIVETTNNGVRELDADNHYTFVNEAYANMLGYRPQQLLGRSVYDYIHPEDIEKYSQEWKQRIAGENSIYELRMVHENGTIVWTNVAATPILNQTGQFLGSFAIVTDITKQKQAEESLRQSEAFIKSIMDNLPIGIAVNSVSPVVKFEYMNENFLKYYRTTREALSEPNTFWDVIYEDPEFREGIKKRVQEDCASGDPARMQWEDIPITRRNRGTFYITAKNIPVPNKPLMISTVWDVTDRKKAEAEREKLQGQLMQARKIQAIGRLAGGVAHDFNNMLGVILGHAEMALDHVDYSHPIYDDLLEIQKAAQRSADLTRQLLAFARKQTIKPRILDLNHTISGMLRMLRRLIGEDINLVFKPGANLWVVKMDPSQIDQILANLAVNARDAIAHQPDTGGGNLTIETQNIVIDETYCSARAGFVPGEYVLLGVSDNGCGMSKEALDNIFEPFFTTKEVGKGTGLGLATIYGIVRQNNGFINVYSEPSEGTSFKIYLPRIKGKDQCHAEIADRVVSGGTETILLVEDEEAILRLGKMILERYGYTVLASASPVEALTMAKEYEGPIHLLITDVVMPGINGKELKDRITTGRPEIKTLFMSGYTANVIAHHGVIEEDVEYLQKPFSVKTLVGKVHEMLDKTSAI